MSDDDAPELRKLLDEIHGDPMPDVLDQDDEDWLEERLKDDPPSVNVLEQESEAEDTPSESTPSDDHQPEVVEDDDDIMELTTPDSLPVSEQDHAKAAARRKYAAPPRIKPSEEYRHSLESLPVSLDFTLKTLQKTLSEVSQLQEGEIIPLGCGPDTAVELKANGRVFARGRMVIVGEELAIEVTNTY